jgi:hypothetical protein
MIQALGDCRCGQHKTLYEAAREAQIFNAPYLHKMGFLGSGARTSRGR